MTWGPGGVVGDPKDVSCDAKDVESDTGDVTSDARGVNWTFGMSIVIIKAVIRTRGT